MSGNLHGAFAIIISQIWKSTKAMTNTEQDRWSRVKGRLRTSVGEDVYTSWFARMDLESVHDESVHLSVPTRFLKSWIQAHYADRVLTCWQAEMPEVHRIDLTVRSAIRAMAPAKEAVAPVEMRRVERTDGRPAPELRSVATAPVSASHDALGGSPLDPRLTFASFVVGRSNTLAHAAARQVAEGRRGDPVMFNPLYIHAGVGLGKTHLLQAVTWAGNSGGERKVLYLTAEKFMYGFVAALKTQTALAFKEALRGIDVLVIDDLQFLIGKDNTQEEFFHTFNALLEGGQQVILTSDRYPKEIEGLEERLKSRFGWGLTVAVEPPELETRVAILMKKADQAKVELPHDAAFFIAQRIRSNVRELEGALKRVIAHSHFMGRDITIELIRESLKDLLALQDKLVSVDNIQRTVAEYYKIKISDLLSKRRSRSVARPRQVAMALSKELTNHSLPEIGDVFGGRDHTTVLHACRKINELKESDADIREDYKNLLRTLTT